MMNSTMSWVGCLLIVDPNLVLRARIMGPWFYTSTLLEGPNVLSWTQEKNTIWQSMILHKFLRHTCRIVESKGPLCYIRFGCHDSTWVLGPLQYTSFWKMMSFLGPWKFMRYPFIPHVESWTHILKKFLIGNCGSINRLYIKTLYTIIDPIESK